MAVNAATIETYDNTVIREDLQEAYSMISPEETPFQMAIGRKKVTNTHFEWPVVSLAAVNASNRVIEGDDAPGVDTGTLAVRLGNYTQISDKRVKTSHTTEAVDAAAEDIQKLSKQIVLKMKELKRDVEVMLLDNVAAAPGSSGNARASAGFQTFLRTNTSLASGGTLATLSGTTTGYPDAAHVEGTTPVALTETAFKATIKSCWDNGGEPTLVLCNSNNKVVISGFTGNSTRYKDAIDRRLVSAIDVYTSDFGELQIVPTRFLRTLNAGGANDSYVVLFIDPNFARVAELEGTKQKPLAETGHSKDRLIWREFGLQVDNEAAHGMIADTTGAAS